MQISALTIYLWQLADKGCDLLQGLGIAFTISVVLLSIALVISTVEQHDSQPSIKGWHLKISVFTIITWIAFSLMPSSKTIAMMVVIPKIAESKMMQQDVPDLYEAAISALKEQLDSAGKKK